MIEVPHSLWKRLTKTLRNTCHLKKSNISIFHTGIQKAFNGFYYRLARAAWNGSALANYSTNTNFIQNPHGAIARLKTHVSGAGQMFWFLKRSWTLNPYWGWFLLLTVTILRVLRGTHDVSRLEATTIIRPVPWISHAASCTMPWWIEDRPDPDSQSQLTTGCIRMHSRQLLVICRIRHDISLDHIRIY